MIRTALTAALLSTIALAGPASATQVEQPDREVAKVKVTYVEHIGPRRVFVEMNDGSAFKLRHCKQEDSRNCFWDAARSGNGRGHSFADIKGTAIYLKKGARVEYY